MPPTTWKKIWFYSKIEEQIEKDYLIKAKTLEIGYKIKMQEMQKENEILKIKLENEKRRE